MGLNITVQIVIRFNQNQLQTIGKSQRMCLKTMQITYLVFRNTVNNNTHSDATVQSAAEGEETLDCGKPVNFTYYDNLVGVLNRNRHPNVPEPQVALIFTKHKRSNKVGHDFDIDALEHKLKKAKREASFVDIFCRLV